MKKLSENVFMNIVKQINLELFGKKYYFSGGRGGGYHQWLEFFWTRGFMVGEYLLVSSNYFNARGAIDKKVLISHKFCLRKD